jgi:hypothetical protein
MFAADLRLAICMRPAPSEPLHRNASIHANPTTPP